MISRETGLFYCEQDEKFYREILGDFRDQIPDFVRRLQESAGKEVWEEYYRAAHSLKGIARMLGAEEFAELALIHQQAGAEKDRKMILREMPLFIRRLEELGGEIDRMLEQA